MLTEHSGGNGHSSAAEMERPQTSRTLKIEAAGDFWRGLLKPKIRLQGRWLERAGFLPGRHVEVLCVAPGMMELRAIDRIAQEHGPDALPPDIPF